MGVEVGDIVQIRAGGIDVTNGGRASKGFMYGEDGPLTCKVVAIVENCTLHGGAFGQPKSLTKVRCEASGVIVWQVQPKDIIVKIAKNPPKPPPKPEPKPEPPPEPEPEPPEDPPEPDPLINQTTSSSDKPYVIPEKQEHWASGNVPKIDINSMTGIIQNQLNKKTQQQSNSDIRITNTLIPNNVGAWRRLTSKEKASIGGADMLVDTGALKPLPVETSWHDDPATRAMMLNQNESIIQNAYAFPVKDGTKSAEFKGNNRKVFNKNLGDIDKMASIQSQVVKYDYQIIPGDKRLYINKTSRDDGAATLETKLRDIRAVLGIPVHGNNEVARAMKYYMYNRFKVPDTNLLHNKSVTYVFFTRPDLNLLDCGASDVTINQQAVNHTESALMWRRYPDLFKLLTDSKRCGDDNNFNMLLSNQVTSFDVKDEELSTIEAGKSWGEYTMVYGDSYTGRSAGEFSCNFVETSDYSVINLLKLWITYIDNVARGAWSPSYNLSSTGAANVVNVTNQDASHVYTKTLDYAASVYVFKCGPDGEDVLYWSKYYGVFPVTTGAGALTWDNDQPISAGPKLNIRFRYAFKRDMSPISLIEFNNIAGVGKISNPNEVVNYQPPYDWNVNQSTRPFVGKPFVQMTLQTPEIIRGGVNRAAMKTQIRLKFTRNSGNNLSDDTMYRAGYDYAQHNGSNAK